MKKREEHAAADTWNLGDLFPSDEAWEAQLIQTEKRIPEYRQFEGKLGQSAQLLYECLRFDDEISLKIERLYVYAKQKSDEDTGNQTYQDFAGRAQSLSFQASGLSAYLIPEILSIDEGTLNRFLETNADLAHYGRMISLILKKKAHTLSSEMEELLARSKEATQGASQIYNVFNNADLKFPVIRDEKGEEIRITHGNYIALMESADRRVRKDAFEALYHTYEQFSNTLAAAFRANVKQSVFYARVRGYGSDLEKALSDSEIPVKVYDNLIRAVQDSLPLLHRYTDLRRKLLKLDELHMYDLYTPMVTGIEKRYTFEEAKQIVKEGLMPLGEEYAAVLQEGFDNRWIDVYENEGKRSGAYSWGAYGTHPYVLLNFNGTLDHVFTLAHEMGHAIHSYYSDLNQPFTYAGYKIFVAEVASTCNEALLIRHLIRKTEEPREKAYLLNHFLESFRGTLFRQTMFAQFEAMAHQKEEASQTLTAEVLCRMYRQLNCEYFGSGMVIDREIDYEWSRIPHFYTPFYVYQYATGFSAAVAISSKILSGDEEARKGYFEFLSGGNSRSPIELLKLCGVDMSTPEPVEDALKVFEEILNEFESLVLAD